MKLLLMHGRSEPMGSGKPQQYLSSAGQADVSAGVAVLEWPPGAQCNHICIYMSPCVTIPLK